MQEQSKENEDGALLMVSSFNYCLLTDLISPKSISILSLRMHCVHFVEQESFSGRN